MRVARSRITAKSGIRPMYQKTRDTVKYVVIANTSQSKGELKLVQSEPQVLGSGSIQYILSHKRPMCTNGKVAAQITAKIVIASAARLIDILHFWRNNNKIAEISVPA